VSETEFLSYFVCFLLGTQTRILFYLSSPPGSELSTASHSCTDVWKFERSYQEATGSGLVTYAISSFLRRVAITFVMQLYKNPHFLQKLFCEMQEKYSILTFILSLLDGAEW